jgi:hypothetical protein
MSRNEIAFLLRQLIAAGRVSSKAGLGKDYTAINRMVARGELFQTSYRSVVCRDAEARDRFEQLVRQGRVLDGTAVRVQKGYLTLYAVNMACASGEMLRFPDLGHGSVLYID